MQESIQDIRFSIRQIHKAPGFSAAVILTIALTISFTAAVFGVLYAVLINPLPYSEAQRIVALQPVTAQGFTRPASYPDYLDWRQMNSSLSVLAGYNPVGSINFEGPQGPVALHLVSTTDNFFDVFGVHPMLGRTFTAGEDQPGRNDVAVLSYEVWEHHFGGRSSVIGETVKLDGHPISVIGVMLPGFRFPVNEGDTVYVPMHPTKQQQQYRSNYWIMTVARLRDGISVQQAEADMARVVTELGHTYSSSQGVRISVADLATFVVGDTRNSLRLLFYAVLALLAIGCVNVAGLLLIRGVKRDRELALRAALGASKFRIGRQILTEALIYAVFGTAVGIVLAGVLLRVTRVLLASALPRGSEVTLNAEVLGAAILASLVITVLASSAPAWRISGTAPNIRLRSGGTAGTTRGQHRLRAAFVVTQYALGLILLVISGLLLVTLARLRNEELGFSTEHVLTAEVDLSPGRYAGRDVVADFYYPLLDKVRALPPVQAAGLVQMLPIQSWGWNAAVHIAGTPAPPPNMEQLAEYRIVSPGYYSVFQDELVRGRLIDPNLDTSTSQPVVVVNEAFVKKFIPAGENPIGRQLDDDQKSTIIGVVRNLRQNIYQQPLAETDYAISQIPGNETPRVVSRMRLVIRTEGDPKAIIPELRRVFHDMDSTLPFRAPQTMREVVSETLIFERLENWLFGSFAVVAVLLAVVGLYGLIGHEVELSRRDIGLRMALGATRRRILSGIYRRVGSMITLGLGIGLALTFIVKRYFESVVAIHLSQDAGYIAAIVFFLAFLGLSAALFPALHSAAIEPTTALREE
jgi:putative ABC transport system permease protein